MEAFGFEIFLTSHLASWELPEGLLGGLGNVLGGLNQFWRWVGGHELEMLGQGSEAEVIPFSLTKLCLREFLQSYSGARVNFFPHIRCGGTSSPTSAFRASLSVFWVFPYAQAARFCLALSAFILFCFWCSFNVA